MKRALLLPLIACLLPAAANAQTSEAAAQSDWIELVKGYKGEGMGTEVMSVETDHDTGSRRVYVTIPKTELPPPDDIEEIVVVGQAPQKLELPIPDIEYEWLDDYDNDNYGLLIHLPNSDALPIRLYVHSDAGFIR